jgi:hypothetical protein
MTLLLRVKTTNNRGVVKQQRVAKDDWVLELADESLVRVEGLERLTSVHELYVCWFV